MNSPLVKIYIHYNGSGVVGITLFTRTRSAKFGITDTRDTEIYQFTSDKPVIGIYGTNGAVLTESISFIRWDLASDCQTKGDEPPEVEEGFEETDETPVDPED